jgi:hypothetical protein
MHYKQLTVAFLCVLLGLGMGCKRSMTRADLETELMKAMSNSLNKQVNFDTTKARFDVKSVTFYEEKTYYDCEFIVRLRRPGYDTTGGMAAKVSKDFVSVNRKY